MTVKVTISPPYDCIYKIVVSRSAISKIKSEIEASVTVDAKSLELVLEWIIHSWYKTIPSEFSLETHPDLLRAVINAYNGVING